MVLDKKIEKARTELRIRDLNDWTRVRPEEITAIKDCGPQTRDHIRLYLAGHGLTLLNDREPSFWQATLGAAKIGSQLSTDDKCVVLPFTVLIDTGEQAPWAFRGFMADADQDDRPLLIRTETRHLGISHGDYSIDGMEGECHIERKSVEDAHGTFLSHGQRRKQWESTLEYLAGVKTAAIVIEGSLGGCLAAIQPRGKRSLRTLQKTFHRQVMAWEQDYRVPFVFCDTRRIAEGTALYLMRRHYRKATESSPLSEEQKRVEALVDSL